MPVQVSEISTLDLFEKANQAWIRRDRGSTAVWELPGTNSKQALILVHGFRGDHHGLAAIAAGLEDKHVLIPDLPGYGKTPELQKHDVESYGKWLLEFIQSQHKPVVLMGHSFGTLVCASAIAQGANIEKLVLVAPISTKSEVQKDLANRIARIFYRITASLGAFGSMLQRSSLVVQLMSSAMATAKDKRLRRWIHKQHHSYFSNYSSDAVVEQGFWSAARSSVSDFADKFRIPVLIIAGEIDPIAPLSGQHELCSKIENVKMEVIPNIGHLLHYEAPVQVAKLMEEFSS